MENLIPFLVVIAYIVLTIVSKVAQNRKNAAAGPGSRPNKPSVVDQMLREMMRQAGIPEEQPVASERRVTASEHRPTVTEHRPTVSETRPTFGEHRPTPSEIRPTVSEHVPRMSEHLPSPGEHVKGDAVLPPIPELPPIGKVPTRKKGRRRRSRLATSIAGDLHGGGSSLARAVVLREILGPPVALRRPGGDV